jgi:hypothetical protein
VKSAFGGFGIYDLKRVRGRTYESRSDDACEHVAFNHNIERLAILTTMRIPAPAEHLEAVVTRIGPLRSIWFRARSVYAYARLHFLKFRSEEAGAT